MSVFAMLAVIDSRVCVALFATAVRVIPPKARQRHNRRSCARCIPSLLTKESNFAECGRE